LSFIRKIKSRGRTYLVEVKNQREDGKIRQKFIRYVGIAPEDDKTIFPKDLSELTIDGSRVFGSVIMLDFLAKQIGLYELLGEHAYPILTLVYCHCHGYQSVSKIQRWFKKTDLSKIFGIPEMTEGKLREAIYAVGKWDLLALQKSIFEKLMQICNEEVSSIIYDVTNTYFTGTRSSLAKPGRDKEGVRGRRLIQIGLVITKKHGFPIFHQVHPGNIHDSRIFGEAISHLKMLGIRKGTIVYDRGITAKNTVFEMSSRKWKIIAGMPMHRGIKNIISNLDLKNIETVRNRVEHGSTTHYVKTINYSFGKTKGKLAILLNPRKKQDQKEDRIEKTIEAQKKFLAGESTDSEWEEYLTKSGKINSHAIKREEKYDGLSCVFTNGKFSQEEIVKMYFGKDLIEKSFQSLKGVLSLRPIRMWLEENIEVHVFICYLAYTLLTTFRFFLEKSREKPGFQELINLSVTEAFDELTDVYRVYFHKDGVDLNENTQLSKLVTLNKRQETILRAVSAKLVL
jgi:transposase